jgi:signal transduction histidine kinase/ligand-binding sensor domain-containing protein
MRGLLLLLLILLAWSGSAQNFTQFHYDMSNGLPDNKVMGVFQDSRGFMWFGSNAGLTRFDGVNFRNYFSTPDLSLKTSCIIETAPGHLLMAAGKLIHMNTVTHQFFEVPTFNKRQVHDIRKTSENQFLVATIDTCFLMDRDLNILDAIVPPVRSDPRPVYGFELYRGMYLMGNHLGYFLYNVRQKKFETLDLGMGTTFKDYFDFQHYDSTNQWIYFANYFSGVYRYSLQGKRLMHWSSGYNNLIRPISDQFLWIGSSEDHSSWVLNLQSDEMTMITVNGKVEYSAYQFYMDALGNYWMATDIGVTRLIINDRLIKSWETFASLKPNRVNFPLSIIKAKDQHVYLSFFHMPFLYKHDQEQDDWKLITKNLTTGVWSSEEMGDELIFTGGRTTRFTLYNPMTGSIRHSSEFLKPYFPNSDIVVLAFRHSNGDEWFSGNKGGGFVRILAEDKSIHHYTKDNPTGNFVWSYYTNHVEDDSGDLWFGVNKTRTLLHWSKDTDSFSQVNVDTIPGYVGKDYSGINRMIRDDGNNLWIGSDGAGVVKYDYTHNRAVRYRYEDGLASNIINSMTFDKKGRLWLGTPNGLNCLMVKENRIRTFTKIDGLKDDEFLDRCMYYDSTENQLWVGTTTTVMRFDPDALLAQPRQEVKVYLDELHINGKQRVHDPGNELSLSFNENNIHFRFVAVNLDRRPLQLSYRLEGQDQDWVSSFSGTTATYANLDPGNYTFTVRANYLGDLNEPFLSKPFTFVVATPWFMTWWFRLSSAVAAFSFMMLLIRSYYSRKSEKQRLILEKERAIEKERTRIATDMHDDFGANLSRIKFISEKIKLKAEDNVNLTQDLTKISDYSDQMAEKMNEIVWALNERYDTLDDLVSFSRAYAAEYLSQHEIQFRFVAHVTSNKKLQGEVRRNLFLVIKEALHNIVKHAQASHVEITFEQKEHLHVLVTDNGKGFNAEEVRPFANGISNMKKRIQDIGGHLTIRNEDGTTIDMQVAI